MAFDIVFRDGSVDFNVAVPEQECPYSVSEYRPKWFVDRIGIFLGQEQTPALWVKNISEISSITDSTTGGSGVIAVPGTLKEAYDIVRPFFFDIDASSGTEPFFDIAGAVVGTLDSTGFVRAAAAYPNSVGFNNITPDKDNAVLGREFRGDSTLNEQVLTSIGSNSSVYLGNDISYPYAWLVLDNANARSEFYGDEFEGSINFKNKADGLGLTSFVATDTYLRNVLNDRGVHIANKPEDISLYSEINTNTYTTQDIVDPSPVVLAGRDITVNAGIKNSDASGLGITVKTAATRYANQFSINKDGLAFEHIINTVTPTADRTATLQDDSGTIAYLKNRLAAKSGVKASGTFAGNPKKVTVTFATAYADANYSVSVIGIDGRAWKVESQVAGSFIINSGANLALTGNVYWTATKHGETV